MEAAKKVISEAKAVFCGNGALFATAYVMKLSCTMISALLVYCVLICAQGVFDNSPDVIPVIAFGVLALVSVIASFPLRLGYKRMTVMLSKGYSADISDLFYYYSDLKLIKGSVKVYSGLVLRVLIGVALVFSVERAVYFAAVTLSFSIQNPEVGSLTNVIYSILTACVIIIFILYMFRYVYVTYLAVENNCNSLNKCVKASVMLARSEKNKFFGCLVHMVHLIALSLLVFPLLYTMPVFSLVSAVLAKHSIASANPGDRGDGSC
ncbi:MAG: hypothetical protein K6F76_00160 [Clostridiales bacterium]|nr:hypothetical protein [Clostridiales bacterium]